MSISDQELSALRRQLESQARAAGVSAEDAEDIAGKALEALVACRPPPTHIRAYLRQAVRNQVAEHYDRARMRSEHDPVWQDAAAAATRRDSDEARLALADRLLRLDAALEHFIVWSGRFEEDGRTDRVVESIATEEIEPIVDKLRYFLDVIDALPLSDRQTRGLRNELTGVLVAAIDEVEYALPRNPRSTAALRREAAQAVERSGYLRETDSTVPDYVRLLAEASAQDAREHPELCAAAVQEEEEEWDEPEWDEQWDEDREGRDDSVASAEEPDVYVEPDDEDDEWEEDQDDEEPSGELASKSVGVRLIPPMISRGAMLAQKLQPTLAFSACVELADRVAAAEDDWDQEDAEGDDESGPA